MTFLTLMIFHICAFYVFQVYPPTHVHVHTVQQRLPISTHSSGRCTGSPSSKRPIRMLKCALPIWNMLMLLNA